MTQKTGGSFSLKPTPRHKEFHRLSPDLETTGDIARLTLRDNASSTVSELPVRVGARHRDFPGWIIELELDGDGTIRQLTLTPDTVIKRGSGTYPGPAPAGGVTARLLRRLPIGAIRDALREYVVGHVAQMAKDPDARDAWVDTFETNPRPGRRGRPDRFFAELAAAYVTLLPSSTPVVELAGERHLSESQVRGLLYEARRRKLLTKPPAGRPGGELTEKAKRILSDEGND